jgi:aminotransferase
VTKVRNSILLARLNKSDMIMQQDHELKPAARTEVPSSPTVGMVAKVREMKRSAIDVISLGAGEPGFVTPEHIREYAKKALDEGNTFYSDSAGIPELRKAIAEKMERDNGISVDPNSEIIVTVGGKEAIFTTIMAMIDPGEEVIVSDPCWVSYEPCIVFAGGVPVKIPLYEDRDFRLNIVDIEASITSKTKMIILNSPNNPTGGILEKRDLEEIASIAVKNDLLVISDELYEYLVYDGIRHYSIASFSEMKDRTITVNGFSKAFAMTGWRLGYMVANKQIIQRVKVIHEHSVTAASTFAQIAAAFALRDERSWKFAREMKAQYEERRNILIDGLTEIHGVSCIKPRGAFYAFPDTSTIEKSSLRMSDLLLEKARVATIPGIGFGKRGEGHIRLTFTNPEDELKEALKRIKETLQS